MLCIWANHNPNGLHQSNGTLFQFLLCSQPSIPHITQYSWVYPRKINTMIYTINVELASWNVIDIIVVMDNIVFALHHGLLRMAYYKGVLQIQHMVGYI